MIADVCLKKCVRHLLKFLEIKNGQYNISKITFKFQFNYQLNKEETGPCSSGLVKFVTAQCNAVRFGVNSHCSA